MAEKIPCPKCGTQNGLVQTTRAVAMTRYLVCEACGSFLEAHLPRGEGARTVELYRFERDTDGRLIIPGGVDEVKDEALEVISTRLSDEFVRDTERSWEDAREATVHP